MAKPILIIKLPDTQNNEAFSEAIHNHPIIEEYNIFVIPSNSNDFEFKVFNGEYTDAEYKRLEQLIEELK